MSDIIRYVNTGSVAGGDGTTNATDVGDSARAFASLFDAEAVCRTLGTSGDTVYIKCSGSAPDTQSVEFIGWVVGVAYVVQPLDVTWRRVYTILSSASTIIKCTHHDGIIDGIKIDGNGTGDYNSTLVSLVGNTIVRNCLITNRRVSASYRVVYGILCSSTGDLVAYNNVITDITNTTSSTITSPLRGISCANARSLIYNNTVARITAPNAVNPEVAIGIYIADIDPTVTNNVAVDCGTDFECGSGTPTMTNCASSDSSANIGLNSVINIDSTVEFVDSANNDFNLNSGSVLISQATVLADVPTDAMGITRGVLPEIGAYEFTGGTARTLSFLGLADNTEVRVYNASDDSELMGVEDASGGSFAGNFTYYADDIEVYYHVHHLDYRFIRNASFMLTNQNISIPIQQMLDRAYKNPA